MKIENAKLVGKHAFEVEGLGCAPFQFVGSSENVITSYLSANGAKGGKAGKGSPAKAASARKAAEARWKGHKKKGKECEPEA